VAAELPGDFGGVLIGLVWQRFEQDTANPE
jgi:hypothetical protein